MELQRHLKIKITLFNRIIKKDAHLVKEFNKNISEVFGGLIQFMKKFHF